MARRLIVAATRAIGLAATSAAMSFATTAAASAQSLHAFGPPGHGGARRLLASFETAAGACVPLDRLELSAAGAELDVGEAIGPCVQWLTIRSAGETVVVRARHGDDVAEATIAVRPAALALEVERAGDRLRATLVPAIDDPEARVVAAWDGGEVALVRERGAWVGTVPVDALIGVVASSEDRVAAAAIAPRVQRGRPEVVVMRAGEAIPAGGTPRPTAFVIVADGSARLSSRVPLHIASERGSLRGLDWIATGVAAVRLHVDAGVPTVDLRVSAGAEVRATLELPAVAPWPTTATIDAPAEAARGTTARVTISARTLAGAAVDPGSVAITCGGGPPIPPGADGSIECPIAGATAVVVRARVGEVAVPLATAAIAATGPPPPPEGLEPEPVAPIEPAIEPPPRVPPPARASTLRLAALAQAAIDLWARATVGGGGSLRVEVDPVIAIDAAIRYQLTFVSARAQGIATDSLDGLAHAVEITGGARLRPFAGVPIEGLGAAGVAIVHTDAALGASATAWDEVRAVVLVAIGTTFRVGDVSLGIDGYARAAVPLQDLPWDSPWLRFGLEVSGGIDLAP